MGKFYDAMRRQGNLATLETAWRRGTDDHLTMGKVSSDRLEIPTLTSERPRLLVKLANSKTIRRLSERLAPKAKVGEQVRVMFIGCRPGDGCSTVAAALAVDLSERLKLPTLLVDAHVSRPSLSESLAIQDGSYGSHSLGRRTVHNTAFLKLTLLAVSDFGNEISSDFCQALDEASQSNTVVIADLGVVRLNPQPLNLVHQGDPLFLVARYAHTEIAELLDTTLALHAAGYDPSGLILNAVTREIPSSIARFFGFKEQL